MKFFEPLKANIDNMIKKCKNGTYKLLENTDTNIKLEYNTKARKAVINVRCADDDMSDMGLEVIHIECRKAEDEKHVDIPFVLDLKSVKETRVFQMFLNVIDHFEEMAKTKESMNNDRRS